MKKTFTLSAGILLLVTILIAVVCNCTGNRKDGKDLKVTTIHIKAVIKDGKKHLRLCDSNGNIATDHLITCVERGSIIIWKLRTFSNIKSIERIYSAEKEREIFWVDPKEGPENVFTLKVPEDVDSGKMEKYGILFIHKDGSKEVIDPYIRIEP